MPRTIIVEGVSKRRVDQLRVGDRVDLEADAIADPGYGDDGAGSEHPEFAFEFQEVCEIVRESADCIAVYFDGFACGFPPDHLIDVDGEQEEEAA